MVFPLPRIKIKESLPLGISLWAYWFTVWWIKHPTPTLIVFLMVWFWMYTLFSLQWLVGFLSFWHRGEVRMTRAKVLPWHIFLGLYTYGLAVATAETGLLEKLTFLQTRRNVFKHSSESMIVNILGLGLVLLCAIVIFTAVSPKYQSVQTKLMYLSDTKCLSSWGTEKEIQRKKMAFLLLFDFVYYYVWEWIWLWLWLWNVFRNE